MINTYIQIFVAAFHLGSL